MGPKLRYLPYRALNLAYLSSRDDGGKKRQKANKNPTQPQRELLKNAGDICMSVRYYRGHKNQEDNVNALEFPIKTEIIISCRLVY